MLKLAVYLHYIPIIKVVNAGNLMNQLVDLITEFFQSQVLVQLRRMHFIFYKVIVQMLNSNTNRSGVLPASIEASPRQILEKPEIFDVLPKGGHLYITDLGNCTEIEIIQAAKTVQEQNIIAVPHIPARRFASQNVLETRLKALVHDAGVQEVLVIAGEAAQPGPFASSVEVLQTDLFDQLSFKQVAIAGHPEGSPDISKETIEEYLLEKQQLARNSDAQFRIVTQFCFDSDAITSWLGDLKSLGIDMDVHIGVAGPAKVTTLLKFASIAGVGNSVNFLKKHGGSMMNMLTGYEPEDLVQKLETHVSNDDTTLLKKLHIYPFGGILKSAEWLSKRGTWG